MPFSPPANGYPWARVLAVVLMVFGMSAGGTGAAATGGESPVGIPLAPAPEAQPEVTSLIVQYAPGTPATEAPGVATGSQDVAQPLAPGETIGFGLRTVELAEPVSTATAEQLAAELAGAPGVISAEPDYVYSAAGTQDPAPSHLDRLDQRGTSLDGVYRYGADGAGVTVYVVDTGIRSDQQEFAGRLAAGVSMVNDGWGTEDPHGHGTAVAGLVGGTTFGTAKGVTLVPVRVLDANAEGSAAAIISALQWIVDHHVSGPAVAVMSLGGPASQPFDDAVNALINDGVVVAAAAGNDAQSSCDSSPGRVPAAITVNSSTASDSAAWFTNYGSCSDIYAPGEAIMTASNASATATQEANGTSMSAPLVAGVAARILSASPWYSPADVASRLIATATPVDFGKGNGDPNRLLFAGTGISAAASQISGADRYATSVAISQASGSSGSTVYVASGENYPDALAAGAAAGSAGNTVLLVRPGTIPDVVAAELQRLQPVQILVLGGPAAVSESVVEQLRGFISGEVTRVAGADRFETAAALSASTFGSGVPVVYVASGTNFPDALTGAAAAGAQGGPILLTKGDDLPAVTRAELARLVPGRIVVLGGEAAVNAAVSAELGAYASTSRVAGSDRFATAAAIAQSVFTGGSTIYVASGTNFPDALSGSPVAASAGAPVLLVPQNGRIPWSVCAEVQRISPTQVIALGGEAAVPAGTLNFISTVCAGG